MTKALTTFSLLSSTVSDGAMLNANGSPNEKTKVYSYPAWDIVDGLRGGLSKTYYPLPKKIQNFGLSLSTKVVRVVRDGSAISGIEVETSSGATQVININERGIVILAAGAMSTPRTLLNSGIGPRDLISIVNSSCLDITLSDEADWIHLPVGENLKDHPIFVLTFNTTAYNASSILAAAFNSPNSSEVSLFSQASLPLVQSGQRLNFWTSLDTTNGTQYFQGTWQGTCNSPTIGQIRVKLYLTHGLTSSGVLGMTAKGATKITTNPWIHTEAGKTIVATMIDYLLNAARNSSLLSYSDGTATGASLISAYIIGDHLVGTAEISATNERTGVVDTNQKVCGTDNLFVMDASIHPDLPTGNTQAIIMVAAEKSAANILALLHSIPTSVSTSMSSTKSSNSASCSLPASVAAAKFSSRALQHFAPTSLITAAAACFHDGVMCTPLLLGTCKCSEVSLRSDNIAHQCEP